MQNAIPLPRFFLFGIRAQKTSLFPGLNSSPRAIGNSKRGGHAVVRMPMEPWMMCITAHARASCEIPLSHLHAISPLADGKSERGDHPVVRMPMKQWMLRITAYADRLLADLEPLDWADSIKDMQRNWIGRSEVDRIPIDFSCGLRGMTLLKTRTFCAWRRHCWDVA